MRVAFIESFAPSLFFITKQVAITMTAVTTDDRDPLTHTDHNTERGHEKALHQAIMSFTTSAKLSFDLVNSLGYIVKHSVL